MKKVFALVALCALVLTSCENLTSNTVTPNTSPLTLSVVTPSNSIMEVAAEGGKGEILYEIKAEETRSMAPLSVTATSDAAWCSDFIVEESRITFTIAPNEDAQRSCFITITYGDQYKFVKVNQKCVEGVEVPDVVFNATHLNGTYWGKYPTTTGFNYLIILGDMRSPHFLEKYYGATEYRFNIYSDVSSAFNSIHRIPVGTYTIDHSSSGRPGTIDGSIDESYYFSAADTDEGFVNATMEVTEDSIVVDVVFYDGTKHHVEYHGSLYYEGYVDSEKFGSSYPYWSEYTTDITFDVTGGLVDLYYRGDYYGTGCDTWLVSMIEEKVDGHYQGRYLLLDLIVPKSTGGADNIEALEGEYSIFYEKPDNYEYTAPAGRFRDDNMQWHAWYMICEEGQGALETAAPFRSGTIKVTVNRPYLTFEFDGVDDVGNKIIGTFSGIINYNYDQSCE